MMKTIVMLKVYYCNYKWDNTFGKCAKYCFTSGGAVYYVANPIIAAGSGLYGTENTKLAELKGTEMTTLTVLDITNDTLSVDGECMHVCMYIVGMH